METQTKQHITRKLRRDQTPWEIKVWNALRNRQIGWMKFRRQFQIGTFVVDFCCIEKKLIVELDGGHHNEDQNRLKDEARQRYLESQGYKMLRFWNNELDANLEGVIEQILQHSKPHPSLSVVGEGENP